MNSTGILDKLVLATAQLDENIDRAVHTCVTCLTMPHLVCVIKKIPLCKSRKDVAWFDEECREAKKVGRIKLKVFRQSRIEEDRREYAKAKKQY